MDDVGSIIQFRILASNESRIILKLGHALFTAGNASFYFSTARGITTLGPQIIYTRYTLQSLYLSSAQRKDQHRPKVTVSSLFL